MIYSVFGEFHFQIKHSWTLTAASVCWDFMLTASCPQGEQQKAAATFNQIFFQILLISFNANVDKGQAQIYNSYFVLVDHSLYLCHHSSCPWIPWRTLVFTRQQRKVIQGDQGQQPGLNVAVCRISHPLSWQFYTPPPLTNAHKYTTQRAAASRPPPIESTGLWEKMTDAQDWWAGG